MQIRSIQVLRALAACTVVIVHAQHRAQAAWPDPTSVLTEAAVHPARSGVAKIMKLIGIRLPADVMVVVLWLGACALGILFWWAVERPITDLLKRTLLDKRQPSAAAQAA